MSWGWQGRKGRERVEIGIWRRKEMMLEKKKVEPGKESREIEIQSRSRFQYKYKERKNIKI